MNIKIAIQILQLAVSLFRPDSAGIAQTLVDIARAASQAYYDQVGQPMDLSLIKPEAGI
jgi:hypothetical protein